MLLATVEDPKYVELGRPPAEAEPTPAVPPPPEPPVLPPDPPKVVK
jgi:hypothetical protein